MLWQSKQNYQQKALVKAYKIHPLLLDQQNIVNWTNLGLWQDESNDYVQAAQQFAQHMGESLKLNTSDRVLDVGCGYGASLLLWHTHFKLKDCDALELQPMCCQYIHEHHPQTQNIFQQSIFDPKPENFAEVYDVILSIDATYHYSIEAYLQAVEVWLSSKGRIGFHCLMQSKVSMDHTDAQWQKLMKKLRWAKVSDQHLMNEDELYELLLQHGYHDIKIRDFTQEVLAGFSNFILERRHWQLKEKMNLGFLKIWLTAQLCRSLAQSGMIKYVEVTAAKQVS